MISSCPPQIKTPILSMKAKWVFSSGNQAVIMIVLLSNIIACLLYNQLPQSRFLQLLHWDMLLILFIKPNSIEMVINGNITLFDVPCLIQYFIILLFTTIYFQSVESCAPTMLNLHFNPCLFSRQREIEITNDEDISHTEIISLKHFDGII